MSKYISDLLHVARCIIDIIIKGLEISLIKLVNTCSLHFGALFGVQNGHGLRTKQNIGDGTTTVKYFICIVARYLIEAMTQF